MMDSPTRISPEPRALRVIGWIFLCLLAGHCILTSFNLCSARSSSRAGDWREFLLLMLGVATTLVTLSHDLPWQNVLAASVIIGAISIGIEACTVVFHHGSKPDFELSWPVPLVWLMAILNARGVIRLVLFRWRSIPTYGFWLFGLTAFLATIFALGWYFLERTEGYSIFQVHRSSLFQAVPISTGALLLASPWLIDKRPVERIPAWEPLITWLSINLLFVTAAFCQRSLFPAACLLLSNLLISGLAVANRIYSR